MVSESFGLEGGKKYRTTEWNELLYKRSFRPVASKLNRLTESRSYSGPNNGCFGLCIKNNYLEKMKN